MNQAVRSLLTRTAAYATVASFFTSILAMVQPIYLMQLLSNVLPGRNTDTLIALSLIVGIAFVAYGIIDYLRARILFHASIELDAMLTHRIVGDHMRDATGETLRVPLLKEVTTLRGFVGSRLLGRLFELPFVPLFAFFIFYSSIALGVVFTLLIAGYLAYAVFYNRLVRRQGASTQRHQSAAARILEEEMSARNVSRAHATHGLFARRYLGTSRSFLQESIAVRATSDAFQSITATFRLFLQATILGVGAWLAILGQMEAGVVIALAWIAARAITPIDAVVSGWEQILAGRSAWITLRDALSEEKTVRRPLALPRPNGEISVEDVIHAPASAGRPILKRVSFKVKAGSVFAVIGPSDAGKSTLLQLMMGQVQPTHGTVRIDGNDLRHWNRDELGEHIGYLPQPVTFLTGTVAETIARHDPDANSADVIKAARAVGMHEIIQQYPEGYNTRIGPNGIPLPAGHQQFIAFARAIYRDPAIIFLDEPNASLDHEGDKRLFAALAALKQRGVTVILVTQRPNLLQFADEVLILRAGQVETIGPPGEVTARNAKATPIARPAAGTEKA